MLLLLALSLLVLSGHAHANCSDTNNPGAVTFSPPGGKITLSGADTVGTILWTSSQAVPASYPTLNCSGTTNNGVVSSYGSPTGSDDTLYPTTLSWLSFRILHPDTGSAPLSAYPYNASVPTGNVAFSVASALQLVVTGTIPQGQQGSTQQLTIPAGKLAQWNVDMTSSAKPVEIFYITNIQFVIPTCTAAVDPTVVTLSPVSSSTLSDPGSTAGEQPFQVQLNCVAGSHLRITLSTANQYGNDSSLGVIRNINGADYATRVGVQILQQDGITPVTFGAAITQGATQNGTMNLPFYARYYHYNAGAVTAGQVSATATYTLTYY